MKPVYRKISLEEIITLAQKDDYKALEELIRRVQKDVFTLMSYIVKEKSEIADLTQTALMRIARGIKSLKKVDKFKQWVNRIVYNVYYDNWKKIKCNCEEVSIEENCNDIVDKNIQPHEKCIASELDMLVKQSILNLPEHFKIAIILRELAGLSYQEISDITKAGLGTVKSRIARARMILQDKLRECI